MYPLYLKRIPFLLLFLGILPTHTGAQDLTLTAFQTNKENCLDLIRSGDLANALIPTTSSLFLWRHHADFLQLSDAMRQAYGQVPPASVEAEIDRRVRFLQGTTSGIGWLDTGLMALALNRQEIAADCFTRTLEDSEFADNPFPRSLLAECLLRQNRLSDATAEYETAVNRAKEIGDPALLYRLRHKYADDLFDTGKLDLAVREGLECLSSPYPQERAWALGQKILFDWSRGDNEAAVNNYLALKRLLPEVQPRPDLDWQRRKYEQATETLTQFEGFLKSDPIMQMIVDEESVAFDFADGKFQKGADTLRPWLETYPIEKYVQWASHEQKWIVWVHYTYSIAECMVGNTTGAIEGFRRITTNVPFERQPDRVVSSWCWCGYALMLQGKLKEAKKAYETGLALDVVEANTKSISLDYQQPMVVGGKVPSGNRASFVANYGHVLRALKASEGEN